MPCAQDWGARLRRVLGGTVVVGDAPYRGEGRALFSDLGSHNFQDGDKLQGPYFPCIYPASVHDEREARARGECTRTTEVRARGRSALRARLARGCARPYARAPLLLHACTPPLQGVLRLMRNMWASVGQMASFTNVVNTAKAEGESQPQSSESSTERSQQPAAGR